MEVLSSAEKIAALVSELRGDLCIVNCALKLIQEQDHTVDVEGITNMLHTGLTTQQHSPEPDH